MIWISSKNVTWRKRRPLIRNWFESNLRYIIISLQNSDTWKIQLTIATNFISSKDSEEERVLDSRIDNINSTSYSEVNDVVNELFKSLPSKYQDDLETSMKRSDFIFDSVELMYYKCYKINFKRGALYIDSPDWIKKKKSKINQKTEDDKCFQYAATVALNYKEIESDPERVSNIKPFINKYNWEKTDYPSKIDGWKKFEKNNLTIVLNILYTKEKKNTSSLYFKSKLNPWKSNNC